jgi:hypothetical protein
MEINPNTQPLVLHTDLPIINAFSSFDTGEQSIGVSGCKITDLDTAAPLLIALFSEGFECFFDVKQHASATNPVQVCLLPGERLLAPLNETAVVYEIDYRIDIQATSCFFTNLSSHSLAFRRSAC